MLRPRFFDFTLRANGDGWLNINDHMGQQLSHQYLPANSGKVNINVEQLSSGTYIVDVHSHTGYRKPDKLIVIK